MSNVVTQLLGVALTVVGLGFTIAQPVIGRLDLLSTSVARMEATNAAAAAIAATQDQRIRTLETQGQQQREAIIRLRGSLSEQGIPTE